MNEYDSNRILDITRKINYYPTDDKLKADCYIINTCHIREKATDKVFHDIGRVKKNFKDKKKPILIITGCVAQAEGDLILKNEKYVDAVIGPQSYHTINDIIKSIETKKKQHELTNFNTIEKFDELKLIKNKDSNISSFLTIQEGCDKFCHFCVVPFTRGPEYSRPFRKIIKEAEELIKNGAKEITLIGQNVNAYSYEENSKFYKISDLLNELEKFSELERIRYTTSHPRDMSDDLIDCYSTNKKLMPFIHLPIQSGSNKILKLMNRKHSVEEYLTIFDKLKKINSNIEFSSDFIISYPGETDEDFNDTVELIKKIKFINSYSFIFSPRPGTKAANLKLIDNEISKERLTKIQKILFSYQLEMNKSFKNKPIDILVENKMKGQNKLFGRNKYLNSVIFEGDEKNIGKVIKVKIESCNQNTLFGEIMNNNSRAA